MINVLKDSIAVVVNEFCCTNCFRLRVSEFYLASLGICVFFDAITDVDLARLWFFFSRLELLLAYYGFIWVYLVFYFIIILYFLEVRCHAPKYW